MTVRWVEGAQFYMGTHFLQLSKTENIRVSRSVSRYRSEKTEMST